MRLTAHEWKIAQQVCTPRQLEALDWWRRHAGYKRIASLMGVDASTAREHVRRARKNLGDAIEKAAA